MLFENFYNLFRSIDTRLARITLALEDMAANMKASSVQIGRDKERGKVKAPKEAWVCDGTIFKRAGFARMSKYRGEKIEILNRAIIAASVPKFARKKEKHHHYVLDGYVPAVVTAIRGILNTP